MQVTHPSDHKDLFDKALLEGVNTLAKLLPHSSSCPSS